MKDGWNFFLKFGYSLKEFLARGDVARPEELPTSSSISNF